jgi:threonine dehydrogenase-like Zn-dependent dehydrogenase
MVSADPELFRTLVSHELPLHKGVEAYRRFAAREEGWTKVVLQP